MISYESLLKGITNVNDCSVIDVKNSNLASFYITLNSGSEKD